MALGRPHFRFLSHVLLSDLTDHNELFTAIVLNCSKRFAAATSGLDPSVD